MGLWSAVTVKCYGSKMSKRRIPLFVVLAAVGILVASAMAYYRVTYPYGYSHCCIIGMSFALQEYAEENGGNTTCRRSISRGFADAAIQVELH